MRIGITGHQFLNGHATEEWVEQEITAYLRSAKMPLEGVTSLALGADQLFARVILALGGKIHVVVPLPDYERTFQDSIGRAEYRALLVRATNVEVLPQLETDEESFFAAGKRVVALADAMLAVWDGKAAGGLGGTADVVAYAMEHRKRVFHVNPESKVSTELVPPL